MIAPRLDSCRRVGLHYLQFVLSLQVAAHYLSQVSYSGTRVYALEKRRMQKNRYANHTLANTMQRRQKKIGMICRPILSSILLQTSSKRGINAKERKITRMKVREKKGIMIDKSREPPLFTSQRIPCRGCSSPSCFLICFGVVCHYSAWRPNSGLSAVAWSLSHRK